MKKILSLVLATALLLCLFGCNDKPAETKDETPVLKGKVALFIGSQESDKETFSKSVEFAKEYGNEIMILGYDPYESGQNGTMEKVALSTADDPEVKAMIFSNGVDGTEDTVKQVREKRSDMFIMVCNPVEGVDEVSRYADVVISLDFTEFGKSMVEASKSMGAENFVFYSFNRHIAYPAVRQLRTAVEEACKESEMTFKLATSVDAYEKSRDVETAKLYITEDVTRKDNKFGKNTVLFSTDSLVQSTLATEVKEHGMMMVSSFLPSPLAVAEAFSVSLLEKPTDSAYVMEELKKNVADSAVSGRVATWGCSLPVLMIESCIDLALDIVEDGEKEINAEGISELLNTYSYGAKIAVKEAECGAYLVTSDFIIL
ncbi:MAG: DUF3798 domain-containing protein [Clostridia bacterium]|nr:DUF3798 domain-containing protein [Clostridia bacterium]